MPTEKSPRLFVSLWDICLDNLPEGSFTHRRIAPDDARARIEQARSANALLCLSDADLLAPYCKRERDNHEALCSVLSERFDITLSLSDFCSAHGKGSKALYTVNALNLAQVQKFDRLLVITCAYTLAEKGSGPPPAFKIEPTTVGFHIIEAVRLLGRQMESPPSDESSSAPGGPQNSD
jgi:hypothetical protein